MELTNADLNFLKLLARRIETYCAVPPPNDTPCKQYNAYRLLKYQELPKLKRRIEKWQATSTGGQTTRQ